MVSRVKFWFVATAFGVMPLITLAFLSRPTSAAGLWYVAPGGSDANDCQSPGTPCATINAAVGKASPGDTIDVAIGTYTANTGSEVVLITQSVTLVGGWDAGFASDNGLSTVDGEGLRRGLTVSGTLSAHVAGFTFQGGQAEAGGGIFNNADLTLERSRVVLNTAVAVSAYGIGNGGGIFNSGNLTLTNSVINSNIAQEYGGGVFTYGRATIISSTVSDNNAYLNPKYYSGSGGGGIQNHGTLVLIASTISGNRLNYPQTGAGIDTTGLLTATNSTISGNSGGDGSGLSVSLGSIYPNGEAWLYNSTISFNEGSAFARANRGPVWLKNSLVAANGVSDCWYSQVTSLGYNLVSHNVDCPLAATDITGVDARLDKLQLQGGDVPVQPLLPDSPAINAGNPGGCAGPDGLLVTDERGYPRFGRCDIGAFETQPLELSNKTVDQATTQPGQPLAYTVVLTNAGNANLTNVRVTDTVPAGVTYANGSLVASTGSTNIAGSVITWTGSVSPGASVTIQYRGTTLLSLGMGSTITNTAIISGGGEVLYRSAVTTLAPSSLYLPIALVSQPGIQGYVTVNGAPAQGIFLELRHFDGKSFSTQLSTNTDASGFYNFVGAPTLPPGQFYYVRYLNTGGASTQLSYWATAEIDHYTNGSPYLAGDFDLANISLVSPAPGATVALPALFQWTRRPATPTDSYQLSLFDPSGTAFAQTAPLGYVNQVMLTSVPSSIHTGKAYGWYMAVNSPDGGYGESYYYRTITFSSVLAGGQPAMSGGADARATTAPVDRPAR